MMRPILAVCVKKNIFLSFLFLVACLNLQAQEYYRITAFRGTVYEMPKYHEEKGFTEGLEKFDSVAHIVLPELNFTPAYPDEHFPDYDLKDRFAFTLNAELKVEVDTCYRITLVSDDGSLLWIDEELSIDNGGMHPWKILRDTLQLSKGEHDMRLWYYNAVGPCGLALRIDPIDSSYCTTGVEERKALCISFNENEYGLDTEDIEDINAALEKWKLEGGDRILITGYTDSLGSNSYNDLLSIRRAKSVGDYLDDVTHLSKGDFEIRGKGEVENISDEESTCSTSRSVIVRLIKGE